MDETLVCYCNKCSATLGEFRNAWNLIGNNYYSPIYPILTYEDGFLGDGDVRSATVGNGSWYVLADALNYLILSCRDTDRLMLVTYRI